MLTLLVLAPVALTCSAKAAEIEHSRLPSGENVVVIAGPISSGDDVRFNTVSAGLKNATVLLSSDGGSVVAAIEIGKSIRLKGFSTLVMNSQPCNSSCALIWLAGSPRSLSKSARIGFHASYVLEGNTQVTSGVGNAIVGRYLTLLNLPEKAVVFATTAGPRDINWLTASNFTSAGIDALVVKDYPANEGTDNSPVASSAGQNTEVEDWRSAGNWTIKIDNTLGRACFALVSYKDSTVFRIGFQSGTTTDGYILFGHPDWSSLKQDQKYRLTAQFDDYSPWDLPSTAIRLKKSIMLRSLFSDGQFWKEFVLARKLSLSYKDKQVATLDLANSKEAFNELIECQKAQISRHKGDPFESTDPFAD